MSPRFYWFLWVVYFVSVGVLWLGGAFTLTTLIVYGFLAFGLTFTGMMCVLPNVVSHPPLKKAKTPRPAPVTRAAEPVSAPLPTVPAVPVRSHAHV